ncbi:MAG TPA: TetR/AcrR family transcriptional regulator [Sporichthya sp.]|nr:TetR/AcrR family transcriptional regulator [Sporichthya sp.]
MADPRPARTRRRLLDAGRLLIARNGVAGLRIADITREAGVALGSFQNHFTSKDDLVAAVVREAIQTLAAEIVGTPGSAEPPAEVAMAALRRFVRLAYEDPAFCALLVNLARGDELFVEAVRPYARESLQRAVAAGIFVIEDLDLTVTFIVAGALGVIRQCLDGLAEPDADSTLARMVLLSMQVDPVEADRLSTLALSPTRITAEEEKPARRGRRAGSM